MPKYNKFSLIWQSIVMHLCKNRPQTPALGIKRKVAKISLRLCDFAFKFFISFLGQQEYDRIHVYRSCSQLALHLGKHYKFH